MKRRCECPDDAFSHEPGKCEHEATRRFKRGERVVWLCSTCVMQGDEPYD